MIHNKGNREGMWIKWIPFRYFYTYLLLVLGPLIIPPLMAAVAALVIPFFMIYYLCVEFGRNCRCLIPFAWVLGSTGLYIALGLSIALFPIALAAYYLVFFTLTCLLLFE